jgi:hypothetical protein
MAGCGVVVFALGLITTGRWATKTVTQTAALFVPVIPPADATLTWPARSSHQ